MKILDITKLTTTARNPIQINNDLFSLGILGALEKSKMIKPPPPRVNRKAEANPSIIYCPLTLNTNLSAKCQFL